MPLILVAACSSPPTVLDPARAAACEQLLTDLHRDIWERAASERLSLLEEKTPVDCRGTDVYKVAEASYLIDLERMEEAQRVISSIDLEATHVPRALEIAFILAVEGGWQSPIEPMRLAERYVAIHPESPIGYVMMARQFYALQQDDKILAVMEKAQARLTEANRRAYLAHAIVMPSFYLNNGNYLEAYRLSRALFELHGDEAWSRPGAVTVAAHIAILFGRREEASRLMSELIQRKPFQRMTDYRLLVLGELARPTITPQASLPADEPTIESVVWPESGR